METSNQILVLGVGNEILTDDGIGPKLAYRLENDFQNPKIRFDTASLGGLELLEFIQGYQTVVFIDAIKTQNGIPGSVYYFTPSDFKETLHLSNLHDVSFLTALKFGEKVGMQIPDKIRIIAIEIIEDLVFSNSFSPEIEEKYEDIYEEVFEYIKENYCKA